MARIWTNILVCSPDYLKNMLYPVSERESQRALRSATGPRTTTWSCHALGSSSANVRSASPLRESVKQYSCWSARHTEHCYVQKEPENIFIPWILFVVLTKLVCNFCTASLSIFRLDALATALSVIATATWLAGWLGVCHSRYCIKTTKPIRKLFGPSGTPVI